MKKMAVTLVIVSGLASLAPASQPDQSWRTVWSRPTLLAAWQRLKTLAIPGVPQDSRFQIAGENRFVSPDGDDANPGTADQPWRTLQKACTELKPNMVVYLKAGTYYGPAQARVQATASAPAAIRAVEGAEVVVTYTDEWVKAQADQLVRVEPAKDIRNRAMGKDGQSKHYPGLLTLSGGFIEVSGLHFIGVRDRLPHNLYSENGVTLSGGTGYRVLYNEVENVGHCGVKAMSHGEHGFLIEGNFLHDLGQTQHDHGIYCPSDDGVIRRNLILNSTGYGIHAYSTPKRIFISHNIVAGHAAYGIILGGPDARVYHNVVFGNHDGGLFFFRDACRHAVVKNNIFWGPGRAFGVDHNPSDNLADYNCLAPEAILVTSPAYTYGPHNLRADPGFTDPPALDFAIRPNSPCVGAGDPSVGMGRNVGLFQADRPAYLDPSLPVETRVKDLISRLTLEEKATLLNHRGTTIERFNIRSDQWNQCLHGVCWNRPTTMFPISLALAATWDTKLVHEEATAISDEARAIYNLWHQQPDLQAQHKGLIYRAPVINIGRNPYWGRNEEAYGEDPFLTGRMAVAYVTGLQGDDPKYLKLVSTLKHYAVNNVEKDRQSLSAAVSERMLHEYWLPHFRDAIVEGQAQSVMASYNAVNGVPSNINPLLLTEILKKQWGFQGFVVSDLGGVNTMVKGHMKGQMSYEDAVAKSLIAGCDFSDTEFQKYLPAAVRQGLLPVERLNDAVYRVMRDRFRLGEFDPPEMVPYSKIAPSVICSPAHRALALKAARESIVLLTNRGGFLPLGRRGRSSAPTKIAVIGPHADLFTPGGYSGRADNPVTPLQGIKNRAASGTEILYAKGCEIGARTGSRRGNAPAPDEDAMIREAAETAKRADVAIVYVGTTNAIEAEGRDRTSLSLPGRQEELVKAVLAANPKTVVVLMNAGPLTIPWIKEHAPALLEAWWGGVEGGNAIADVLFGDYNPSGRLPHTVYASESQVPPQDEYDVTKGFTYMYLRGEPLFAFGHGLSYTKFHYGWLRLSDAEITRNGEITATVQVTNTGRRSGDEVVQLYIHEVSPAVKRPVKELRGFERIHLQIGQTKKVTFTVPAEKLAYYDEATHRFVVKPGEFEVLIGSSSQDIRVRGRFTVLGEKGSSSLAVEHLRCEYRENPLGIEAAQPRLSWWLRSAGRGQHQAAYQVLVASTPEVLARGEGDLWDSGRVASDRSVLVPYQGKPLAVLQQVWWKVRAWPQKPADGQSSAWSEPATWTMGLPQPQDWHAKWIALDTSRSEFRLQVGKTSPTRVNAELQTGKDGKPIPPLPLLRKAFQVDKAVRRAVVCICGLGQYELAVNGSKIGDHVVDPGWTNYRKRCLYATYDVTASLRRGENVIGVILGNGMYNVTGGRYVKFLGSFGPPKLILQMRMDFADGSSTTVVSDETWKGTAGPIRFSCTYGGEDFDARAEPVGWNAPGFDDQSWAAASVTESPGGRLEAQAQPPVKVMQEFKTVRVTEPQPGVLVYDLGQNFSGRPTVRVKGPAGARVKLIPGELLDAKGAVSQRSSGGPTYFTYTLKGTGEETWHPRFSYYGFRYVQVERLPAAEQTQLPEVLGVGGQFIHSSAAMVGTFECSNPLVNRIHGLIDAAILSSLQSVLTDCPHREKLGWLEVSHLLGVATMFNYDLPNFYAKICQDMADSQTAEGLVPDIAPEYVVFKDGFRDSPEWGSAAVIDPWLVYQMYGDTSLLEKHYDMMARYVAYLGSRAKDHIVSHGLGDWYDIGPKPPGVSQLTSLGVTATAVYYQDVQIMEQAARLLHRQEDAKKYGELAATIQGAFNRTFFHPETAGYDRNSQTANAMPLLLGLVPQSKAPAVADVLVKGIRENGNRVTAGDVGFHYVVAALTENGRNDVLYDMVTQDAGPGYAYQLRKGATTLTEAWDTNPASSQNHCMLGHAEEWFYRGLGGISPDGPGFRELVIRPAVVGDLAWAHAAYESVRGKVQCAWRREGNRLKVDVEVPIGAEATVYVPAQNLEAVTESGKPAAQADAVRFVNMAKAAAIFRIGSGTYSFESVE